METLTNNATELLLLLFLIITFVQSAFDKMMDWKGNISWLQGHFKDTPFQGQVPLLLITVLVTELVAGVLCLLGMYMLVTEGGKSVALAGAVVACIALLMLLLGQRIAKDYDGARTIAIYFIPTVFLVFLLQ
ncbi:MAG: DoxX family protein [Arenibacter sp.]|uniref:DoxX family protein n=1 Tax=Arenibacter TaxID=178469 RepID=UPI000A3C6D49|nr:MULTISPECIES: DoxX family protein [Arenibacter]MDX1328080.1 DoxX family protein [Arenibacter sp.]